uniref:Uncharacterized protein n=1 Tax=Gadus morhua TaxID=8049 RepID=A0A8C4ZVE8_GADMO
MIKKSDETQPELALSGLCSLCLLLRTLLTHTPLSSQLIRYINNPPQLWAARCQLVTVSMTYLLVCSGQKNGSPDPHFELPPVTDILNQIAIGSVFLGLVLCWYFCSWVVAHSEI